jgi:hypothetical protein
MTKHSVIAYHDDGAGDRSPITFEGDAWRRYIPLRLPWTLRVRDRAPPGCAAVLINRAHVYPDLALPIDAAQQRIFVAIDGNRSLGAICRYAAGTGGDQQARDFVQRLWEYEQIVFDTAGSH